MQINTSNGYIQQSYERQNPINNIMGGNPAPASEQNEAITISQSARDYLQQTEKTNQMSKDNSIWLTGKDLVIKFGTMALGGEQQLTDWKEKGLDISYKAIEAAFNALQAGFQQLGSQRGGVSINRHETVKSTQETADWFEQEYQNFLASIQDMEMKKAFAQGKSYYAMPLDTTISKALSAYQSV